MKYWYKFSDSKKWEDEIQVGRDFKIPLYEETEEIVEDFESKEFSDWWPIRRNESYSIKDEDAKYEFSSMEEAEEHLYTDLSYDLYCRLHDC